MLVRVGEGPPPFMMRLHDRIIIGDDARDFIRVNTSNSIAPGPFAAMVRVGSNESWNSTNSSGGPEDHEVVCPMIGRCHGPIMMPWNGTNGTEGSNSSSNWSAEANGTGTWLVRLPPGFMTGNAGGYADCRLKDGGVVVQPERHGQRYDADWKACGSWRIVRWA